MRITAALLVCATHVAHAAGEQAVTQYVPDTDLTADHDEARPDGWDGSLVLGASFNFAHNSDVVGQRDGLSLALVANVLGNAEYRSGAHEVTLRLSVFEGLSTNSAVGFTKSNDLASIEPLYSIYMFPWLGLFVRANAETSLLPTEDVRPDAVTYLVSRRTGMLEPIQNQRELKLGGPLEPLTMTQSMGLVCRPIDAIEGVMLVRIGVGGRETIANGTLLLVDDPLTSAIEVRELRDVLQAGAEMAIRVSGRIPEQRITYDVDFSALMPVINNDLRKRSAFELFRVGLVGNVHYSLADWVGVTWQFKVLQDPQLTEEAQIQNNVLLTFQWSAIESSREKKPDPAQALIAEAQARERAAREREAQAEERVRRAEE